MAALTGLCAMLLLHFLEGKSRFSLKSIFPINPKYLLAGLMALLPFLMWNLYKQQWHLSNDLEIGNSQSIVRILSRVADGSYIFVLQNLYKQIEGPLALLGIAYAASVIQHQSLPKESLPTLITAALYYLGMAVIYLLTPHDLAWQLGSSIDRTMLSVNGCVLIGSYYILNALENKPIVYSN